MSQVIDYAGRPPTHYPAGIIGSVRYVAPRQSDGSRRSKCVTPEEIAADRVAGRSVAFVFEDNSTNALGGVVQGDHDGAIAVAEMQALGVPRGVAIFAAVDRGITAAQMPGVAAYLDAFHKHTTAAGYRRGVYGDFDVQIAMLRDGHADMGWQCSGWSGGKQDHDPRVVLFQTLNQIVIDGTTCDVNDVWQADWGQWNFAAAPPPQQPITSTPGNMEASMRYLVPVSVADHRGYTDLRKGVGGLPADVMAAQVLALTYGGDDPSDGWGPRNLSAPELVDAGGIARIVVPQHEVATGSIGVYVTVAD